MSFLEENVKMGFTHNKSYRQLKSTHSIHYQEKGDRGPLHLVMYEQFIAENLIRINGDNKIKIRVYNLAEKSFVKEENCVNLLKWKFPHFVHGRVRNISEGSHSLEERRVKSFFNSSQEKISEKFEENRLVG